MVNVCIPTSYISVMYGDVDVRYDLDVVNDCLQEFVLVTGMSHAMAVHQMDMTFVIRTYCTNYWNTKTARLMTCT